MRRLRLGKRIRIKEPVSAISHFLGALGALIAVVALIVLPRPEMSWIHFGAFVFYGLSMFAVYMASALYHGLQLNIAGEKRMNRIDHSMIYVFIAGSYAPIFLVATPMSVAVPLLSLVFVVGVYGIFSEYSIWIKSRPNSRKWGAVTYVVMGWLGVLGVNSMLKVLPASGVGLIALGGVLYTVGAVIYALKRPNPLPRTFGFHELFHLFILAGSICHFWAIWRNVMPLAFRN